MPYTPQKTDLKYTLYFLGISLFLLCVVFLTPHNGSGDGKSFFAVAQATQWQNWGDWMAAWCSVKIMLLSMAGLFLMLCIEEALLFLRRNTLANLFILMLTLPVLGFGVGFYYLVKSVF